MAKCTPGAEFFIDALVEDPQLRCLTVVPSYSPEDAPKGHDGVKWTRGASMDAQILRDLFDGVAEAAKILGREREDGAILSALAERRARLAPLKVGRWGQLMEWTEDLDDPEDTHRHISHLYALYPSAQITPQTLELFEAAKTTLVHCGDVSTGWGMAWRIAWWARLHDRVRGLRARGGYFVDMEWRGGRLVSNRIYGGDPDGCEVVVK